MFAVLLLFGGLLTSFLSYSRLDAHRTSFHNFLITQPGVYFVDTCSAKILALLLDHCHLIMNPDMSLFTREE